jgi:hypothetical protein
LTEFREETAPDAASGASGSDASGDVGQALGAHAASMQRRGEEAEALRRRQLPQPRPARTGGARTTSGQALFDRRGEAVAWVVDDRLIGPAGEGLAWLRHGGVHSYAGRHLGWWCGDHMRGHDGGLVAFLKTARGLGMPLPVIATAPPAPMAEPEPRRGLADLGPEIAPEAAAWSGAEFGGWRPAPDAASPAMALYGQDTSALR